MYHDLITASLVPPARITVSENQQVPSDKTPPRSSPEAISSGVLAVKAALKLAILVRRWMASRSALVTYKNRQAENAQTTRVRSTFGERCWPIGGQGGGGGNGAAPALNGAVGGPGGRGGNGAALTGATG